MLPDLTYTTPSVHHSRIMKHRSIFSAAACKPLILAVAGVSLNAVAQQDIKLDPVVVTATRNEQRAFDLPVSIDVVDGATIRNDQLQVNLSESLVRVPGIVVQNRSNYAQDLQVSSRGFGARAAFGTRGIRLFQDGIPATMPDGQGQTGSFSLASAERIEVMRGPFSTLYGNASAGVIAVFTEDGPKPPAASVQTIGGSYGTWNTILKAGGDAGSANLLVAANEFRTHGFRDHSAATRDLVNIKLKFAPGDDTRATLIANSLYQPEAQDPLGVSRAQWEQNPRQVDPVALQFNTRKTVSQQQAGTTVEQRLGADSVFRTTFYGGARTVRQYLALSGVGVSSSGGVADLDRDYGGIDARVEQRMRIAGAPLTLTAGVAYDRQHERRRGFVNNSGNLGDLRRDEDDTVSNRDVYAQAEWHVLPAVSVLGGARYSDVRFGSLDHFIVQGNPDDSGNRAFTHTSPVAGVAWHVGDDVNVYANYGEGFETPTFAELAYSNSGTGLNFALQPSVNRSGEIGLKAKLAARQRVSLAAFKIDTDDEIVTDTASGGRTTYRNAGKTRRHGVEASWTGELGRGFSAYASATYLSARFASDIVSGTSPVVPSGSRLPGVPASSAYAELSWVPDVPWGFSTALELQYANKVYVNDRNSDAAPSYTVANLRAGLTQETAGWTLSEFVRVNNLADRNYVGSVIVGDANGRFFEPAPGRNYLVGVSVNARF
jgi:iron complex outermembrane receptor protein